jgi:hypothetical protein
MPQKRINTYRHPKTTLRRRPKKPVKGVPLSRRPTELPRMEVAYSYLYRGTCKDGEESDKQYAESAGTVGRCSLHSLRSAEANPEIWKSQNSNSPSSADPPKSARPRMTP